MKKNSSQRLKEYYSTNQIKKSEDLKKHVSFSNTGLTSCSFKAPFLFIKYIIKSHRYNVYEREKHLSTILNKFDWYPKLLYADDKNKILIFRNVGIPLTRKNKPDDLKIQFKKILSDMKSVNVKHNDIKQGEILVNKNGKIFLCDFGWASINNDFGCGIKIYNGSKPSNILCDKNALQRLELE